METSDPLVDYEFVSTGYNMVRGPTHSITSFQHSGHSTVKLRKDVQQWLDENLPETTIHYEGMLTCLIFKTVAQGALFKMFWA
jgi:hypothetical protein